VTIRDATAADLPTIVAIYNAAIPGRLATADTETIAVESRAAWLAAHGPATHPLWVAEADGAIAGWLSFQPFYGRPAYRATAELSVYVAPAHQRRGVARALVAHAIDRSPALGFTTLLGFVFGHNAPSLALFAASASSAGRSAAVAVLDGVERDLAILGGASTAAAPSDEAARDLREPARRVVGDRARARARDAAPPARRVTLYDELESVPPFHPDRDREGDVPPRRSRACAALLQAADAVVLSTPEYAFGVPGVLKNALDWTVASGDFAGSRPRRSARHPRSSAATRRTRRCCSRCARCRRGCRRTAASWCRSCGRSCGRRNARRLRDGCGAPRDARRARALAERRECSSARARRDRARSRDCGAGGRSRRRAARW
jgi:phosphinothricin acetyltransferase